MTITDMIVLWLLIGLILFNAHVVILERDFKNKFGKYEWEFKPSIDGPFLFVCLIAGPMVLPSVVISYRKYWK